MPIFAITQLPPYIADRQRMGEAIEAEYAKKFYQTSSTTWLVYDPTTAKGVCKKLGITKDNQEVGSATVFEIASYFGIADPAVWSWMRTNWSGGSNE